METQYIIDNKCFRKSHKFVTAKNMIIQNTTIFSISVKKNMVPTPGIEPGQRG